MNLQEQKQFVEHWKQVRRRGLLPYVALTALSWGTFSAFFVRLFTTLIDRGLDGTAFRSAFVSKEFLLYWAVFLAGGVAYAFTLWFYFNHRFRKLIARQKPLEAPRS